MQMLLTATGQTPTLFALGFCGLAIAGIALLIVATIQNAL